MVYNMKKRSMKQLKWVNFSAVLLVWFVVSGCDAMVRYQFQVVNGSSQRVDIAYKAGRLDTTIAIPVGDRRQIYQQQQLNSGVKPYFTSDTIWWFNRMAMVREDSLTYQGEPRLVERWTFIKGEEGTGIYELTLKDDDFR
jgi:hypothetical protein